MAILLLVNNDSWFIKVLSFTIISKFIIAIVIINSANTSEFMVAVPSSIIIKVMPITNNIIFLKPKFILDHFIIDIIKSIEPSIAINIPPKYLFIIRNFKGIIKNLIIGRLLRLVYCNSFTSSQSLI